MSATALLCVLTTLLPSDAPLAAEVHTLTESINPDVVTWRRHLHQHPELSNREEKTAAYVVERLRAIGVDHIRTGVAHHGVVALIRGRQPGPVVALRADMDALPVTEQTDLPFASQNEGVMHACGHDVHTAVLLGTAHVLVALRAQLNGTVKLIFQPAEEGPPTGEEGGAKMMVAEGVLSDPAPDAIFALHTMPELEAGKLGYALGGTFASVDRFRIRVVGKQVHAAYPWGGIDPIVSSAHIITALQSLPSRRIDARDPVVVSVGRVQGGQRWNIIPGEVVLDGTIRTQSRRVRSELRQHFTELVEHTAAAHGATAEIHIEDMAPVTWNDEALGRRMIPSLERAAGAEQVVVVKPAMGGEDFAWYAKEIPGFYIRLGTGNEGLEPVYPLHTPHYQVDEASIPVGVRVMSLLALDFLGDAS